MSKYQVGQKIVVTNIPPYSRWSDHNKVRPNFVQIEILQTELEAKGEWDDKIENIGILGKGSDSYMYGYNYPKTVSNWVRHCPDEEFNKLSEEEKTKMCEDLVWYDVATYQCPALPEAIIKQFPEVEFEFCEKHQVLQYKNGQKCFYCKMNFEPKDRVVMNTNEHAWKGWY